MAIEYFNIGGMGAAILNIKIILFKIVLLMNMVILEKKIAYH